MLRNNRLVNGEIAIGFFCAVFSGWRFLDWHIILPTTAEKEDCYQAAAKIRAATTDDCESLLGECRPAAKLPSPLSNTRIDFPLQLVCGLLCLSSIASGERHSERLFDARYVVATKCRRRSAIFHCDTDIVLGFVNSGKLRLRRCFKSSDALMTRTCCRYLLSDWTAGYYRPSVCPQAHSRCALVDLDRPRLAVRTCRNNCFLWGPVYRHLWCGISPNSVCSSSGS